jgi:hypothetical protein
MQQSNPPNSFNGVDSAQNKELLWTTLQESGAFAGLASDRFQPVYAAFERSVQRVSRSMSSLSSLSDVNKHIIRQFVQTELPTLRSANANANANANTNANMNSVPTNNAPKKKKIEMVYRAEDLQNERAGEFERQLREKQAEMDSFLTLKKPSDVSFTDAAVADDKPIGDEMSRLIAQELATRERELVQLKPEDIKKAQQWIGTTSSTATELPPPNNFAKKSVSFSNMTNVVEEHEMEQFEPNEPINNFINENNFEETDFIFSKFKKISEPSTDAILKAGSGLPDSETTIQQLYNKLLELEQSMNAKHDEIIECLHRLNVK